MEQHAKITYNICSGWRRVHKQKGKNMTSIYEYRVCTIDKDNIVSTETMKSGYKLPWRWEENEHEDIVIMKRLFEQVVNELKSFTSKIFIQNSEIIECIKDELLLCKMKVRSLEYVIKMTIFRICTKYLKPEIKINTTSKKLIPGYMLIDQEKVYDKISNVFTLLKTRSSSYNDSDQKYFDSIEFEIGYPTFLSKQDIRRILNQYGIMIKEFIYDQLFLAIMKKTSLWNKIPDILFIIKFLKLERIQIAAQNILIFKFVVKEDKKLLLEEEEIL